MWCFRLLEAVRTSHSSGMCWDLPIVIWYFGLNGRALIGSSVSRSKSLRASML